MGFGRQPGRSHTPGTPPIRDKSQQTSKFERQEILRSRCSQGRFVLPPDRRVRPIESGATVRRYRTPGRWGNEKRPCGPHEWGVGRGAQGQPWGNRATRKLVFPNRWPVAGPEARLHVHGFFRTGCRRTRHPARPHDCVSTRSRSVHRRLHVAGRGARCVSKRVSGRGRGLFDWRLPHSPESAADIRSSAIAQYSACLS